MEVVKKIYMKIKEKTNKLKNNKKLKSIIKFIIIILFIILSLIVANKHEHWSDEAQSFLLARDTTINEIFKYIKYEGTPPLWVLTIKLFILLGGNYKTFYILPIIMSTIGIIIFEYKIKVPWYIKIIFPFTYFMFYQYTIVARSYCLVFPLLMLLTTIYEKRFKKPITFIIVLFIFMNISLHTLVISGSLYLIYIIESIITKKIKERKILNTNIAIFFELLLTALITYPEKDCVFGDSNRYSLFHVISEATIGSNLDPKIEMIIGILILVLLACFLEKKEILNFVILLIPVSLILMFIRFQVWHVGIIWLLIFTYLIITNQINNKVIEIFVLFVCIVQSYWTISSINYDYYNKYSASKNVADYLKEQLKEDKIIYGLGYSKTAIQPYFEENIFKNKKTKKAFHIWAKDSQEIEDSELLNCNVDIFVVSEFYIYKYQFLIDYLKKNNYQHKKFNGYTYIKDYIYETESYRIYTKQKA